MKIAGSSISMSSSHQSLSVKQSHLMVGMRTSSSSGVRSSTAEGTSITSTLVDRMVSHYSVVSHNFASEKNPVSLSLKGYDPDEKDRLQQEDEDTEDDTKKEEESPSASLELSEKGKEQSRVYYIQSPQSSVQEDKKSGTDKTMSSLRALLHYLKSISNNPKAFEKLEKFLDEQTEIAMGQQQCGNAQPVNMSVIRVGTPSGEGAESSTTLASRRETFEAENEYTTFNAEGIAKTEDGRELSFNVDFAMSRDFMHFSQIDERMEIAQKSPLICDPLVINVGADVTKVSDQKFTFDLDADGKKDSISLLGEGSGFLALDKNEDGTINDGSELFGAKSGNGFMELAAYDEDHNGWIDENDAVFDKLRIWFKDDAGNDQLLNLKSADVGALYLGNTSTEFALKNQDTNNTNGIIRSTGLFLRESGAGAGTIQHVDLAL